MPGILCVFDFVHILMNVSMNMQCHAFLHPLIVSYLHHIWSDILEVFVTCLFDLISQFFQWLVQVLFCPAMTERHGFLLNDLEDFVLNQMAAGM